MMQKFTLSILLCTGLLSVNADAQVLQAYVKLSTSNVQQDSLRYYHSGGKATGTPKYARLPEFMHMADSMQRYSSGAHAATTVCTYNASNEPTQHITQTLTSGTWKNSARTRVVYKNNKPDSVYYDTWSSQGSGAWRLSRCIVYTWSANDIGTATQYKRSTGRNPKWENEWKTSYSYLGGKISDSTHETWKTGSWNKERKKKYTWTAGQLSVVEEDGNNGSNAWKPFYKAVYKYDGSGRVIDIKNDMSDNAGGWKAFLKDTIMYNSGNSTVAPDTIIRVDASTGSYVNAFKAGFEHDAAGRITKSYSYSWNGTTSWVQNPTDSINKWYWIAGSDVETVVKKNSILNVYPSPANSELHITLDGILNKQVTFAVTDMQGRVAKSWTSYVNGVVTVSVADLPAGNYVLQLNDGTQVSARKFVVSR